MKKCVFVSDSFKGTLSSPEICRIAREAVHKILPECLVDAIPVADGGEGTVDCFAEAVGAERRELPVTGPWGEPVTAAMAIKDDTAFIEMASCAGLPLVGERRDPSRTTTYGVGEQIRYALEMGCRRVVLGLGGSATNDGGCGMAAALGVEFYKEDGSAFVPCGGTLKDIDRIDDEKARKLLAGAEIIAMCDVTNSLCGPNGAAAVFGPQKGADEAMVRELDAGLRHMADRIMRDLHPDASEQSPQKLNMDIAQLPGAGAAGGMGAGCVAYLGAKLQSGIDTVLDVTEFDRRIADADLVFTGEGRIDSQSLQGKVISGVAKRTSKAGVPLVAIVGKIDDSADAAYAAGVTAIFTTNRGGLPFEELQGRSAEDYRRTLEDILRLVSAAGM